MTTICMRPIGIIHSAHRTQDGTPIQPRFAEGSEGTVELFDAYVDALQDLRGFERIWLLYVLDRAQGWKPLVIPFRDTSQRGLFATRAPSRPNPLGMSAVGLLSVERNRLRVSELDVLDGTPLLDIKPYVPMFDAYPNARAGWIDQNSTDARRSDDRFA